MIQKNLENSQTKKVWTRPTVTTVDLRLARHGSSSTISDSGSNAKS